MGEDANQVAGSRSETRQTSPLKNLGLLNFGAEEKKAQENPTNFTNELIYQSIYPTSDTFRGVSQDQDKTNTYNQSSAVRNSQEKYTKTLKKHVSFFNEGKLENPPDTVKQTEAT